MHSALCWHTQAYWGTYRQVYTSSPPITPLVIWQLKGINNDTHSLVSYLLYVSRLPFYFD